MLKARKNPLTIELLFLDGEEAVVEWTGTDNTYGSRHYVDDARQNGSLATLKALILVDMIGDRDLQHQARDELDALADRHHLGRGAARRSSATYFVGEPTADRGRPPAVPRRPASRRSTSSTSNIQPWHTAGDTLDAVSARSLQVVGDVLLAALPQIEAKLK